MMVKRIFFLCSFMVSLILWIGCEQADVNCLASNGKTIKEQRMLGDFDSVDVRDYVNLIITQDTVNRVIVESGENIINGITTEIVDRQLNISNKNRCNWLRSYDVPVNVYISVKNLMKIYYNSSGNITTANTLRSSLLKVEAWGGCGTIDLDMDIYEGYFILQIGTVDFNLHGHCAITTIYSGDYGPFNCKDLKAGYTFVTNAGSNDCYVTASQYLEATIKSIGNIYYTGTPDSVDISVNGSGKVIHL